MLKVVEKQDGREASEEHLLLDEIARKGARRMLMITLNAIAASATSKGAPQWCAMVTAKLAR